MYYLDTTGRARDFVKRCSGEKEREKKKGKETILLGHGTGCSAVLHAKEIILNQRADGKNN